MKKELNGICPVCQTHLQINRYICPECHSEFPVNETIPVYSYLDETMQYFLSIFIRCEGSIATIEKELGISYPTVKKRISELQNALGLSNNKKTDKGNEEIDMSIFNNIDRNSGKASDIIKAKLADFNGRAVAHLWRGDSFEFQITPDGNGISTKKLGNEIVAFSVFDIIFDFLKESGGVAPKGAIRGKQNNIGIGNCTEDTVMYQIATKYYRKKEGQTAFDPLFVLAAILEWAGIAENGYGTLRLL